MNADDGKQTWRVVLADGDVREVVVTLEEHGWSARTPRDRAATRHRSAEMAVRRLVATYIAADFDVREVLAPGEPTRAELVAQWSRTPTSAEISAHRAQHPKGSWTIDARCVPRDKAGTRVAWPEVELVRGSGEPARGAP